MIRWLLSDGAAQFVGLVTPLCATAVVLCAMLLLLALRSRLRLFDGELFLVRTLAARGSAEHCFMSLHGLRRSALHGLVRGQPWIGVELSRRSGRVGLGVWIPRGEGPFVTGLLRGVYPGAQLERAGAPTNAAHQVIGEFALTRGNYLPIRTLFDRDDDPLASVLSTLGHAEADVSLQLLVRPTSSRWQMTAYGTAQRLRDARTDGCWPQLGVAPRTHATQFERDRAEAIESKASGLGFECVLRVIAAASSRQAGQALVRSVAASLLPFSDANAFALRRVRARMGSAPAYPARFPLFGSVLLTAKELAAMWHAPDEALLESVNPMPATAPSGAERGERRLGLVGSGRGEVTVGLSVADSRSHLHLLGSTGTGKTTALLSLAVQDIEAGRGVAVLDPKGDLVRGLLDRIPRKRIDDVVLISPEERETSVGINPLQLSPGDDRDLVAENVLTIFKRVYERYWGPRTDDILKSALLTLLHIDGLTLAHVPVLLTDDEWRTYLLGRLDDPLGLDQFWKWFNALSDAQRRESTGPVLNKLRDFLIRPRLRRLLCQSESTVDMRAVVDGRKILLADLSVGLWGETTAALIGSFLVARIWQAVLARSAVTEEERRDFFLYLDEFQHFIGIAGPFSDALAEARSLRLSLTIANQHLGQLTRELRDAVASNARSRIVFQCGQDDAAYLAREFAPLDAAALMSLGRFEAATRLAIDGQTSRPFTLRTLLPAAARDVASPSQVRAAARRFAHPVDEIDAELRAALPVDALQASPQKGKVRTNVGAAAPSAIESALSSLNEKGAVSRREPRKPSRTTPPEEPEPV